MREHNPPTSFGIPAGGARRWLLPLFLTLAPLLLLSRIVRDERQEVRESRHREFLQATDPAVSRLREGSKLKFWAEQTARRFQRLSERALRSTAARPDMSLPERLSRALRPALRQYRFRNAPADLLWVMALRSPGDVDAMPRNLTGPDLKTLKGQLHAKILARLFQGILRREKDPAQNSAFLPLLKPVRGLFGENLPRELFSPNFQGQAFQVIYQSRFYLLVWSILREGGSPVGGFVMLMDAAPDDELAPYRLILENWDRLVGQTESWPAFFRYPGPTIPGEGAASLCHPELHHRGYDAAIASLARDFTWATSPQRFDQLLENPPKPGDGLGYKAAFGSLTFPADRLGKALPIEGGLARLIPLGEGRSFCGVMIGPAPPPAGGQLELPGSGFSQPSLELFFHLLLTAWVLGWLLVLILTKGGWRLPLPRVGTQLVLWFFILVSLPMGLVYSSGLRLVEELATRMEDETRRQLEDLSRSIEGESSRLAFSQTQVANRILLSPQCLPAMHQAWIASESCADLLEQTWKALEQAGCGVQFLLLVGPGDYHFSRFDSRFAGDEKRDLDRLLLGFTRKYFDNAPPVESASEEGMDLPLSQKNLFGNDKKTDLSLAGQLGMASLGSRQLARVHHFARTGERIDLYLAAFWDHDLAFRESIVRFVRSAHGTRGLELGIFLRAGGTLKEIAVAGRGPTLRRLAARPLPKPRFIRDSENQQLIYLFPSAQQPGYVFVTRASLAPVMERIKAERSRIFTTIIGCFLLVVLAGWTITLWLARPITEMTAALTRVGAGDLTGRVAVDRRDELGQAAATLNQMITGLEERDRMRRFVTSQVLEVISEGSSEAARAGTRRPVVALFSDIRNFTTLSEAHPPEEIFLTLNRHFEEMTLILHHEGGLIERFIGDAIQAVFYDTQAEAAAPRAVRAALAMTRRLDQLNENRQAAGTFPYQIGIGIAAGEGVSGVVGDPEVRQDFTVLGEPIRQAGELEAASKAASRTHVVCCPKIRTAVGSQWQFLEVPGHPDAWEVLDDHTPQPPSPTPLPPRNPQLPTPNSSAPPTSNQQPTTSNPSASPTTPQLPPPPVGDGQWFLFPALALWILASFLIWTSGTSWRLDWREHHTQSGRNALARDLLFARKTMDPGFQVATFLRSQLLPFRSPGPPATLSGSAWQRGLEKTLGRLSQQFDGLSWFIVSPDQPQSYRDLTAEFYQKLIVASGGPAVPWSDGKVGAFHQTLVRFLTGGSQSKTSNPWEKGLLEKEFDFYQDSSRLSWMTACGGLTPVKGNGREFLAFWEPLREEPEGRFENRLIFRAKGRVPIPPVTCGILVFLPQESLSMQQDMRNGFRALVGNLAARGTALAIVPRGSGVKTAIADHGPPRTRAATGITVLHPLFRRVPRLQRWLEASRSRAEPLPGWFTDEADFEAEGRAYRLLAARHHPGDPPLPLGLQALFVFQILWLIGGGLGFGMVLLHRAAPPLALRWKLAGVFLAVLVPALIVSATAMERLHLASATGLERSERQKALETLDRVEEGSLVIEGWTARLLTARILDVLFQRVCQMASQAGGPDQMEFNAPWLIEFFYARMQDGIMLRTTAVGGPNGKTDALSMQNRVERGNFGQFLALILRNSLDSLNPRPTGQPQTDLRREATNATRDELMNTMSLFTSPDLLTDLLGAPQCFLNSTWGKTSYNLFRLFFPLAAPRFVMAVSWDDRSVMLHVLSNLLKARGAPGEPDHEIRVSDPLHPNTSYVRPFFQVRPYLEISATMEPVVCVDPPECSILTAAAHLSGETMTELIGKGRDQCFFLTRRLTNLGSVLLTMATPIGRSREALDQTAFRLQLLLLGLLGLTCWLAWEVSRRFLEPLSPLTRAAEQVTAGNFRVVIDLERTDEFGALAQAFNGMCRGIEEGRILSRFVSESVRLASRDIHLAMEARKGRHQDSVILFAGVAGSDERLRDRPPAEIMAGLNRFLESLSRVIRAHDGEIDKFIGEKVLAVFTLERHETLARAAAAAMAAGVAMAAEVAATDPVLGNRLGVGIVTGRVLAGILGTEAVRLEFTVLGDPVNLAARLCELGTRQGRPTVLADAATAAAADPGRLACRPLGATRVKGKLQEVEVFHVARAAAPDP